MGRRFLRRNDAAVSEVVGYILTFALSAIILLISVQSFTVARQNSDAVVTAVELKAIANRVANRIVEAGQISDEFPNATYTVTVNIPQDLNGHPYFIQVFPDRVFASTMDGMATAEATTFRLDATSVSVSGKAYSSEERILVTYVLVDDEKLIRIR